MRFMQSFILPTGVSLLKGSIPLASEVFGELACLFIPVLWESSLWLDFWIKGLNDEDVLCDCMVHLLDGKSKVNFCSMSKKKDLENWPNYSPKRNYVYSWREKREIQIIGKILYAITTMQDGIFAFIGV
jgi:hypothetical protein